MKNPFLRLRVCAGHFLGTVCLMVLASSPVWPGEGPRNQHATASSSSTLQAIPAAFSLPSLTPPVFPNRSFDIRSSGARDGGKIMNTAAIQCTIDSAARSGGGRVVIPKGRWLTGAIHLENNIDLHLAKGATLLFSQDPHDYLPVVFSRHEDTECFKHSAFLYARGKRNIAVTGQGVLDGQGKPWWALKQANSDAESRLAQMGAEGAPLKERVFDGRGGNLLRPAFFQPMQCTNVLVEGVTFRYGAFWTITPTYCDSVIIRGIKIVTEGDYGHVPNGDGVNPSSSKNVLIEDCEFDTGDDCIALKAGRGRDGLRVGIPTENVVIRNCRGLRGHGGIVVGSETAGGIRNVYATSCRFDGTDRIVRIKTARGRGGIIENLWFCDLSGERILREAIHVNMLYTGNRLPASSVSEETPRIRNVYCRRITCLSGEGYAVEVLGLPEMPAENLWFDSLQMRSGKGVNLSDVLGIHISNSSVEATISPLINLVDVQQLIVDAVQFPHRSGEVLRVEGGQSRDIVLRKTIVADPEREIWLGSGVRTGVVTIEK